jgi:hypothetical protein
MPISATAGDRLSPESPVTYREFHELAVRVDTLTGKLDDGKADTKDVDHLADMFRELASEVRGLRRVLIGFMVAIALGAVTYSFTTFQLLADDRPPQSQESK